MKRVQNYITDKQIILEKYELPKDHYLMVCRYFDATDQPDQTAHDPKWRHVGYDKFALSLPGAFNAVNWYYTSEQLTTEAVFTYRWVEGSTLVEVFSATGLMMWDIEATLPFA